VARCPICQSVRIVIVVSPQRRAFCTACGARWIQKRTARRQAPRTVDRCSALDRSSGLSGLQAEVVFADVEVDPSESVSTILGPSPEVPGAGGDTPAFVAAFASSICFFTLEP